MAQAIEQANSQRKTSPERARTRPERREQTFEPDAARQALAFQAILAGVSPERLPAELAAALSERIGNQAMLSALSRAAGGRERSAPALPESPPATEAAEWSGGAAASEAGAPAFSSLSEL